MKEEGKKNKQNKVLKKTKQYRKTQNVWGFEKFEL